MGWDGMRKIRHPKYAQTAAAETAETAAGQPIEQDDSIVTI